MNSPERNPLSPRSLMDIYRTVQLSRETALHVGKVAAALAARQQPPNLDQPPTEAEILRSASAFDEADRRRTSPITEAEIAALQIELDNKDERERRRLATLDTPSEATIAYLSEVLARDNDSGSADDTKNV